MAVIPAGIVIDSRLVQPLKVPMPFQILVPMNVRLAGSVISLRLVQFWKE